MKYQARPGDTIQNTASDMHTTANNHNRVVSVDFNGINIVAWPRCNSTENIVRYYWAEASSKHERYINSQEYRDYCRKTEEAQRERETTLKRALTTAPDKMTLQDVDGWQKAVAANTDSYGSCCIRYTELWARLMESRITNGETMEECAEETSHIANTDGITGFMYGCAVSILSQVWVHGEALRRWHNLKTQIKNEGESANESGGVLNPAMLCMTT